MKTQPNAVRIFSWAICILVIGGALVSKMYVRYQFIPQNGMYPTLPQGTKFWAKLHPYGTPADVKRGDIITFGKVIEDNHYTFIWRVVGLPGDHIQIRDTSVKLNGRDLPHTLVRKENGLRIFREETGGASYQVAYQDEPYPPRRKPLDITVPPDTFFVLGDNRDDARDSRVEGPVAFGDITGKKL
jgi:signal peptidase I